LVVVFLALAGGHTPAARWHRSGHTLPRSARKDQERRWSARHFLAQPYDSTGPACPRWRFRTQISTAIGCARVKGTRTEASDQARMDRDFNRSLDCPGVSKPTNARRPLRMSVRRRRLRGTGRYAVALQGLSAVFSRRDSKPWRHRFLVGTLRASLDGTSRLRAARPPGRIEDPFTFLEALTYERPSTTGRLWRLVGLLDLRWFCHSINGCHRGEPSPAQSAVSGRSSLHPLFHRRYCPVGPRGFPPSLPLLT